MQSFLVCSKDKKLASDYAITLCKKNIIDTIDIDINNFAKKVGIEDIRNIQKKLILKPLKSKTKAVILEAFNGLTIEAQNALLKLLEEPPPHTIIVLITTNKELLLPTILSRCKIIELKDDSYKLSQEKNTQYLNILISLSKGSIGEKLKLAQDISKNKDEVIPWLERIILVAREKLIDGICHSEERTERSEGARLLDKRGRSDEESPDHFNKNDNVKAPQYLNLLISLQKTHTLLNTTNVNQRLALENLFLNL